MTSGSISTLKWQSVADGESKRSSYDGEPCPVQEFTPVKEVAAMSCKLSCILEPRREEKN